jgi:hypothetical protein
LALAIGKPTGIVSSLGISAFGPAYDPASDKNIITAYKITAYKNPIEMQPKSFNLAPFALLPGQKVEIDKNKSFQLCRIRAKQPTSARPFGYD